MLYEYVNTKQNSIFGYTDHLQTEQQGISIPEGIIKIIWNRNEHPVDIEIDGVKLVILPYQLISCTYFHQVVFTHRDPGLSAIFFNREFYCIADHDSEVSCNGILFFGTQDIPIISLDEKYARKFDLLLEVVLDELQTRDNIQGDMLQMLLKRWIIICTRLAKEQLIVKSLQGSQVDIIRQYNFLVDMHFRSKKKVKDYAEMLHKSPKTLSNLFSIYNQKSPQQVIQERVVLEAKRLFRFTDKQTKEIAYELGFEDPAHFSRYFKKVALVSPSAYRENLPAS